MCLCKMSGKLCMCLCCCCDYTINKVYCYCGKEESVDEENLILVVDSVFNQIEILKEF